MALMSQLRKEIQTLFRNACPQAVIPTDQNRDMDSVSDWGAGYILVSEAKETGSDPRLKEPPAPRLRG